MRKRARAVGQPLDVLVVEDRLSHDGATRVTLDRAARWAARGARVSVLTVFSGESEATVPPGVELLRVARRRWLLTLLGAVVTGVRRARTADVVVSSRELGNGLLVGRVVSLLVRRPFAVTVQSRWDLTFDDHTVNGTRRFVRWSLRSAARHVVVSRALSASVERLGVPPGRIRAVTNGIDVPALRRAALAGSPDGPVRPTVVAIGRLAQQKGFDRLIRAHALLRDRGAPDHCVVIVGEGPERAALERLRDELGVAEGLRLPGALANPHPVLSRADLFVLPSRYEGWPLSLAEAVSLGVPSIAFDCVAGPREVLDDGAYGELVVEGDTAALAAAIEAHLRSPAELRGRAARGGRDAASRFDPDVAADRHLAVLTELRR